MKPGIRSEIMLALRSPDSSWLGVLACIIDEAARDPRFDGHQRALAKQMLDADSLPESLINAARLRADCFEVELEHAMSPEPVPVAHERPKLTLVGSSGA